MGTPYLSEIRLFSFNFAPKGWTMCSGQLLPINQNQALFALLGTTYGGDGRTTFGLPDLRGRAAVGVGSGGGGSYTPGQVAGEVQHTLAIPEMPQHNHAVNVNNGTGAASPTPTAATVLCQTSSSDGTLTLYSTGAAQNVLASQAVGNAGGSQPHPNMMPYLAGSYCIALQGIFPSRN